MNCKYKDGLGLIVMDNCYRLGEKIDNNLRLKRNEEKSFIINTEIVRFDNGEGKVVLKDSVRDKDIYILSDIGNYSETYNMYGFTNHKSPDDHFQDIKRVISSISNQADRITVVMPLLYESRQHKKRGRESLDCAFSLQELQNLGVNTIVTFDVHDPNIQNAVPTGMSFENFYPTDTILKEFIINEDFNLSELIFISPDVGAMDRVKYYANVFGSDVGMFYKRRDLSKIVDGKNPVVEHVYLGAPVKGKIAIVVDDMIASGGSMIDVASSLDDMGVKRVFLISTFSMFTKGVDVFKKAYISKKFEKLYSTNLTYSNPEVMEQEWFCQVDCSNYVSDVINTLNMSESISNLRSRNSEILAMINNKK